LNRHLREGFCWGDHDVGILRERFRDRFNFETRVSKQYPVR
jgi:hypothetical protein